MIGATALILIHATLTQGWQLVVAVSSALLLVHWPVMLSLAEAS